MRDEVEFVVMGFGMFLGWGLFVGCFGFGVCCGCCKGFGWFGVGGEGRKEEMVVYRRMFCVWVVLLVF